MGGRRQAMLTILKVAPLDGSRLALVVAEVEDIPPDRSVVVRRHVHERLPSPGSIPFGALGRD